ncbi:hypothetical protein BDN67DRAFT_107896 [Paxillus ammoniavirescens]|nr:hypothetical protein BDN67DRAFT_107896 [Paxillus ammoniavirescens]
MPCSPSLFGHRIVSYACAARQLSVRPQLWCMVGGRRLVSLCADGAWGACSSCRCGDVGLLDCWCAQNGRLQVLTSLCPLLLSLSPTSPHHLVCAALPWPSAFVTRGWSTRGVVLHVGGLRWVTAMVTRSRT